MFKPLSGSCENRKAVDAGCMGWDGERDKVGGVHGGLGCVVRYLSLDICVGVERMT